MIVISGPFSMEQGSFFSHPKIRIAIVRNKKVDVFIDLIRLDVQK